MTLRDRCQKFHAAWMKNGILRQSSPVDDLEAFVLSERGKAADNALENSCPLVLYFKTEIDRQEFLEIAREALPGLVSKKMP